VRDRELAGTEARSGTPRVRIGTLEVDRLSFSEAIDRIEALVLAGRGGAVFTPNVDHVVNAERLTEFRNAYAHCDVSLADGQPLVWLARLLGSPLPERIAGSDLVLPLMRRAADRGWRVYLLGGRPGVAVTAARILERDYQVQIAGIDSPELGWSTSPIEEAVADRIRAARPQLLLAALGSPKQELWIHRWRSSLAPVVALGVGASLDFIAGTVRRAPRWMSRAGLEWLFRLMREPRLARRYLWNDPKFLAIALRELRRTNQRLD
jgi:N-acetylglucosaminyldiphosphoundecaprenol N-acetyl-beta-D-mannosaminyltransferase